MSDQPLFIELFPINKAVVPQLTAYAVDPLDLGAVLAERLTQAVSGHWLWFDHLLITNEPLAPIQTEMLIDNWREADSKIFKEFQAVTELIDWQPYPLHQAEFVYRTQGKPLEAQIQQNLTSQQIILKNCFVHYQYTLNTFGCYDTPVLSIGVQPRLLYAQKLDVYLAESGKTKDLIGLRAMHIKSNTLGEISKIVNDSAQITVESQLGEKIQQEFPLADLHIALRREDLEPFEIPIAQAAKAMLLPSEKRAALVKQISEILKTQDLIGNAYNNRTHPNWFAMVDFVPSIVYGENRAFEFDATTLADTFLKGGVYQPHPRFDNQPIKIAAINTLDEKIDDFMEAMRRQLERTLNYQIELIKERKVRVLSEKNLQSATRAVEKESPHIVLAFFPDAQARQYAPYLKSLVMGKGIASHVITERIMNNPDAMTNQIMNLLSKTGNSLYALAEPLEYTDYVVGLSLVRESHRGFDRITAMARLYQNDGVFLRYILHQEEIDPNAPIPLIVMQTLLPLEIFGDKRVILHRMGLFSPAELESLARWQQVLSATLIPVEIIPENNPRLYSLQDGINQPPWGTVFRLNPNEAILTTTHPDKRVMLDPLLVRLPMENLPTEQAVYSVLAWTLLHSINQQTPRLPVSIHNSDQMAIWLAKGIMPTESVGEMPFWL